MGGGGGGRARELKLQFTPTWIIALVCAAIVVISIFIERRLHSLGKLLKKKNQNTLFQALQKVKEGWHTYFWMAFVPLALLLAVGMKLEHVITQLAHDVAVKQSAIHGDLVVKPSDEHFWLKRPRIMLYFIHFILFQNAFEIAFFFWILATYGWGSCIMDKTAFIIPRLVIGVIIQILCSYSTLPLYAIVTQMGSSFKKAIFDEHLQESLVVWAKQARKRTGNKASSRGSKEDSGCLDECPSGNIQTLQLLSSSRHVDSLVEGNGPS